jgi:hypothetical protein
MADTLPHIAIFTVVSSVAAALLLIFVRVKTPKRKRRRTVTSYRQSFKWSIMGTPREWPPPDMRRWDGTDVQEWLARIGCDTLMPCFSSQTFPADTAQHAHHAAGSFLVAVRQEAEGSMDTAEETLRNFHAEASADAEAPYPDLNSADIDHALYELMRFPCATYGSWEEYASEGGGEHLINWTEDDINLWLTYLGYPNQHKILINSGHGGQHLYSINLSANAIDDGVAQTMRWLHEVAGFNHNITERVARSLIAFRPSEPNWSPDNFNPPFREFLDVSHASRVQARAEQIRLRAAPIVARNAGPPPWSYDHLVLEPPMHAHRGMRTY